MITIPEELAAVLVIALFVAAAAACATVCMLILQRQVDRIDVPIVITRWELIVLYALFAFDRIFAGLTLVIPSDYFIHLSNTCTKVALATALVLSCISMFRRLYMMRGLR